MSKVFMILTVLGLSASMVACEAKSRYQPGNAANADAAKKAEDDKKKADKANAEKAEKDKAATELQRIQDEKNKAAIDEAEKARVEAEKKRIADEEKKRKEEEDKKKDPPPAPKPPPAPAPAPAPAPGSGTGTQPAPAPGSGTAPAPGTGTAPAPAPVTPAADQGAANKQLSESITNIEVLRATVNGEKQVVIRVRLNTENVRESTATLDPKKAFETGLELTNTLATDKLKVAFKCLVENCSAYEVSVKNQGEKFLAEAKIVSRAQLVTGEGLFVKKDDRDRLLQKIDRAIVHETEVIGGKFKRAVISLLEIVGGNPVNHLSLVADLTKPLPQTLTVLRPEGEVIFKDVKDEDIKLMSAANNGLEISLKMGANDVVIQLKPNEGQAFRITTLSISAAPAVQPPAATRSGGDRN